MPMNDLLQTRLFGLLSEPSQEVTNEKIQNRIVSNGNDYSTAYRTLVATRIEIASLETTPLYGQGEKCA